MSKEPFDPNWKLPEDVAKKYKCTTPHPRYATAGADIDLRTISLKRADSLVADGFPHLVPVTKAESAADKDKK